ncbi:10 kDa heat shock protein, mitochondrial-like [Rhagoletis pomonella]|uniref:10 kDa heat shock protein, mitochondrial-like n=1 Tax=Rhagoletis pomonella TaxID=28610 RepID=UPI00177F4FC6|nr:10 kDa heat shock protein, mitochondrial-like [Rhagoletis pomonella]
MASIIKRVIPTLDRILVRRAEAANVSKGGIVLTEKGMERMVEGTVIAVGPGARNPQSGNYIPIGMKEGDRVLLPKYGGTRVEMQDKKEYVLYREADILAKLE